MTAILSVLALLLTTAVLSTANSTMWWDPEWPRDEFVKHAPPEILPKLAKKQKHLVFKVGPPASGKTGALKYALRELGIGRDPFLEINIDRFVLREPAYKEQTEFAKAALQRIVADQVSQDNTHMRGSLLRMVQPSSRMEPAWPVLPPAVTQLICQTDFQAYYKHRPAADKEAQALLFAEFLESPHYRNLVYESTGSQASYQFILKLASMARMHEYKVHIVYPIVRWTELLRRSEVRALKHGRLVCPERIRQIRRESRWNLRDIIRKLDSPTFPVDSVLLVSNEGAEDRMRKICHFHKMPERRWRRLSQSTKNPSREEL